MVIATSILRPLFFKAWYILIVTFKIRVTFIADALMIRKYRVRINCLLLNHLEDFLHGIMLKDIDQVHMTMIVWITIVLMFNCSSDRVTSAAKASNR